MRRFLVTSIGRTGTKWLAKALGVDHEPAVFNGRACSPRHLYLMVTGWQPPKGTKVVVMTRNAEAQMLSICNRAAALGEGKLQIFKEMFRGYLRVLNRLVAAGAPVIHYEDVIGNLEATATFAFDHLGIDCLDGMSVEEEQSRLNAHPQVITELPPWAKSHAKEMQRHYDAWHQGETIEETDPTRHAIRYAGRTYQMDYVFPAEIASLRAHKSGLFQELPVLEWVKKQKLKGVYIDCGAHIGNHTLFFLEHCHSTQVYSIEAHPEIFALMKSNIERNSNRCRADEGVFRWVSAAAWHTSGIHVKMAPIPHNNAGHTHIANSGGRKGEKFQVKVPTVALDDVCPHAGVRVLKIDVEDVEEDVIKGATSILVNSRPVIIAERHNKKQLDEFEALLRPFQYKRTAEWSGIHTYAWT